MLLSLSFSEFKLKERLHALEEIGLSAIFDSENNSVDVKHHNCDVLGSAHTEAARSICDPIYTPKMWNMDNSILCVVNKLHYQFWCWRTNTPYIDIEEQISQSIKNFIVNAECKEQDKWIKYTPEELKEKVIKSCQNIFNDSFHLRSEVGYYIFNNFPFPLVKNDNISWTRIHSQLFK